MAKPTAAQVAALELALEEARALAESRRLELLKMSQQLDEILRLAASQNEQLSDLRQMMRRRMGKRRKDAAQAPASTDTEDDPTPSEESPPIGADSVPASPPAVVPPERKRRTRPPGAGRRPLPDHLSEILVRTEVCACLHCGSSRLLARDREESCRLDVVETIARLRREIRDVVVCKDCGQTSTAPPPSLPCKKSKVTCDFLAWLVVMKFVLLVPADRIRRHLQSQGVDLPASTFVRWFELASDLASAVDGAHWKTLRSRRCLLTDGTGLKVLVPGLPKAWDAVLDVFSGDEIAVYQFALTKHGDELAGLLRGFSGVLMCDAESRLNEICRTEGVKRANCNAHPRRAFRDAEAVQPILAKEAGQFLTRMYAVERKALRDGHSGDALRAIRQAKIRPIVEAFRRWLEPHRALLPSDLLGKAVRYYVRHFAELTRFIDDPDIPIDNNPSERAFQDHAKLRLNALFAGSPEGGRRWAILLGVVTTAKRHGLDVQAYLTWLFERRGTRKRAFGLTADQLTPAAYKQMLEQQRRQIAA